MSKRCSVCSKPAKHLCAKCKQASYCGKACQQVDWVERHKEQCSANIGLKVDQPDMAGPAIDDDNIVGIETADGAKFRIPIQFARQMDTLSNILLENTSFYKTSNIQDNYIPLTTMDGPTFQNIVTIMRHNELPLASTINGASYLNAQPVLIDLLPKFVDIMTIQPFNAWANEFVQINPNLWEIMYFLRRELSDWFLLNEELKQIPKFRDFVVKLSHREEGRDHTFYQRSTIDIRYLPNWALKTLIESSDDVSMEKFLFVYKARKDTIILKASTNYLLKAAVWFNRVNIVRYLLSLPETEEIKPNTAHNTITGPGAGPGWDEIEGIKVNLPHNAPFCMAAAKGHYEICKLLLDLPANREVNPAAHINLPIIEACKRGHVKVVKLLLGVENRGINPAAKNNQAIIDACEKGHLEIVKALVNTEDRGIDVAAQEQACIIGAISYGKIPVVDYLLDLPARFGVDVNIEEGFGISVLATLADIISEPMIIYLLTRKDRITYKTYLDLFRECATFELIPKVKIFIENDFDVLTNIEDTITQLIETGFYESIKYLLSVTTVITSINLDAIDRFIEIEDIVNDELDAILQEARDRKTNKKLKN